MSLHRAMELRHLRYFVAVADALHFSRAAGRLNLTQPALSRQIRDLEDELGVALLRRHGAQTTLTPAGARFVERAKEILAAAERAADEARATARVVRFGHYGALWANYCAPALRAFVRRFPQLTLQPVELSPGDLAVALRRGEVDMALLGPVNAALRREFATRRLGVMPAMLAIGAGNPLAKRRAHALADLREAEWVGWDERAFPGRGALLREAAAAAGFKPRVTRTVDSLASILMHATTSRAIGYVLPISKKFPHSGVVFAALKPPAIVFEMNVAWRRTAGAAERLPALAELLATTPPAR
jgi:DNA-binding transcriptional LysR family regulator